MRYVFEREKGLHLIVAHEFQIDVNLLDCCLLEGSKLIINRFMS